MHLVSHINPRRSKSPLTRACLALGALFFATSAVHGQTSWLGNFGTDWGNVSNWDSGLPNSTNIAVNNNTGPNEPIINSTNQTAGGLVVGTDNASDFSTLVTLTNGNLVVSGNVQAGWVAGATGQINLEEGSTIQTTAAGQNNIIGNGGAGTLDISFSTFNGTGQPLTLGLQAGATGNVLVTDLSAVSASLVTVGDAGSGILSIAHTSSGNFTANLILGNQSGGSGNMTVEGFNTNYTLAVGGSLVVGLGGNGSLTGNNNSRINISQNVTLGQSAGANGTILITDQFSTMNVTNTLNVGYGGTGSLTIANNGNVTVSDNTTIGFQAGANGTVTVTDSGSVLNAGANLAIGTSGSGTLIVSNSAQVNTGLVTLGNNGTVNLNSSGVLATSGLSTTGTGALSFNGGTLTATANSSAFVANFTSGQVNLGPNGGTINDGGFDVTINSPISGNGNLTKTGTGTVTLNATAASNYTGLTNVTQGTLNLEGNLSQSSVVVSAGATLSGNGAIGGSLTLSPNSKVTLNSGIGTLSVTGNVVWNGATTNVPTITFQLGNSDNTSDRIAAGADFTKGSGTAFQFDFTRTGYGEFETPTIYTLITYGGTTDFTTGDFSYINLGASAGHWGYFNLGGGALTFTVVPEPAEFALAFGALTLLFAARRRQRV